MQLSKNKKGVVNIIKESLGMVQGGGCGGEEILTVKMKNLRQK